MPAIAPIILVDTSKDPDVNHTFNPTANANGKVLFTDRSPGRAADWLKLSSSTAVASGLTGKMKTVSSLTVPVPVEDQAGCCVDKDGPTVIAFNTDVAVPTGATQAQVDTALSLFRSWVNSTNFADTVAGNAFY